MQNDVLFVEINFCVLQQILPSSLSSTTCKGEAMTSFTSIVKLSMNVAVFVLASIDRLSDWVLVNVCQRLRRIVNKLCINIENIY